MRPTELLQEIRKMRFEETFSIWTEDPIAQNIVGSVGINPYEWQRRQAK